MFPTEPIVSLYITMELLFDFWFHLVGDDHHFTDEFLKRFDLNTQIILFTEIVNLVVTVMAGNPKPFFSL